MVLQLDEGGFVDIIYMDFHQNKSFDTVSHQRLLTKVYGINGKVLDWITILLTNRKQRVVVDDALSRWVEVMSDNSQASVLRPVLFVLFINVLPNCVKWLLMCHPQKCKMMTIRSRKNKPPDRQDYLEKNRKRRGQKGHIADTHPRERSRTNHK